MLEKSVLDEINSFAISGAYTDSVASMRDELAQVKRVRLDIPNPLRNCPQALSPRQIHQRPTRRSPSQRQMRRQTIDWKVTSRSSRKNCQNASRMRRLLMPLF